MCLFNILYTKSTTFSKLTSDQSVIFLVLTKIFQYLFYRTSSNFAQRSNNFSLVTMSFLAKCLRNCCMFCEFPEYPSSATIRSKSEFVHFNVFKSFTELLVCLQTLRLCFTGKGRVYMYAVFTTSQIKQKVL